MSARTSIPSSSTTVESTSKHTASAFDRISIARKTSFPSCGVEEDGGVAAESARRAVAVAAAAIGGIANDGMDDGLITRVVGDNCKQHDDGEVVDDRDCRAAASDGRVRRTSR